MTEKEIAVLTQISDRLERLDERLDRIEAMLIQVRDFTDATAEAVAPFLSGKGHKWLALVAKAKGGRT